MRLRETPLYSAELIEQRVAALARQIDEAYAGRELVLAPLLKGAAVFATDLMRQLHVPVNVEYVRAQSYEGTESSGTVEFSVMPDVPVTGRHVLMVDDILDTGRTITALRERFEKERPASLALCVLLDKPARRKVPVVADYVGFTVDDHFVVGYGLDYEERFRQLPEIYILDAC